jgi:cytochrome c-type biogenesis protein CcmE
MNKRARNRLIGVTAIILIVAAAFIPLMMSGGAKETSVADLAVGGNAALVGTRVKVTGAVVAGSWDKKTNPMVFKIRTEGAVSGPEVLVTYNGSAPNTFGSDTIAILTGQLDSLGSLTAGEMVTKCPSKYETSTEAAPIADVLAAPPDSPIRMQGFVVPGSQGAANAAERFKLAANADGTGASVAVAFTGTTPAGFADGVKVVVFGKLENGVFVATDVALSTN